MQIEQIESNSHVLRMEVAPEWEKWLLLTADHHWDNPHCDRDLLKKHLGEAVKRDALIFCFGDLFCMMQGKYDPRRSKAGVRPEHNRADYLDAVIADAAEWYAPYMPNFCFVSPGNHESSILNRLETNPLERFVERVAMLSGTRPALGKYGGWIRLAFKHHVGLRSQSLRLNYFHGSGGGGPVTQGVIQHQRRAAFIEGADIVVGGHVHDLNMTTRRKEYLDIYDKIRYRDQVHLTCSTYKEEYHGGEGWHIERGAPPKPLGSWWVRLYWTNAEGVRFEYVPCT